MTRNTEEVFQLLRSYAGQKAFFGKAPFVTEKERLNGWIPLFLSKHEEDPVVEWAYMGVERFTEPFCYDTLQRLTSLPFNRLF
jgi:hypothetical protein